MTRDKTEDWDPRSADILDDPISAYDTMRHKYAVAWSDYQQWSVFRHADAMRLLTEPETFSNNVSDRVSVPNGMDAPKHQRYRELIEPYFSANRVEAFRPVCQTIAEKTVGAIDAGEPFEAMSVLAEEYALRVQCAFMGWPDRYREILRQWLHKQQAATLAGDRTALKAIASEFDGYIHELIDERVRLGQKAPNDNTTALMNERVDGRPLSHEELVSLLRNWTVGEVGTISASVGILLNYLARYIDLQAHLRNNPQELSAAIDEILRIDAPLMSNRRRTTCPVHLGGRDLDAGERLTLLWASVNRDERVFGDPDRFDPVKNAPNNLLYGAGPHVCPGAPLARMELTVFMSAVLTETQSIELATGQAAVRAHYPSGGFAELPIVWR
ncbi:cytochrome P450 [Saccharospirillum salsuginis]|uniref:Cytochrome P450 n=1 Tax=Saccharospirillum salsuginis TaxID=418750 RepID=A0A918KJW1_9GAMM|nr:cytochrome P450 [Saccharospirillum salsuginis]GGX66241.1 cytochrome P450 [Saccharospirillum salsuginis]